MEEKRTNEPSKVGTFLSSAANRVLNLLMILVIIALAALVAWFWHENELLQNDIKNLNEKVEDFEKMSSMDKSRDVVVREEVEESENIAENEKEFNEESDKETEDVITVLRDVDTEIRCGKLVDFKNEVWSSKLNELYKKRFNAVNLWVSDSSNSNDISACKIDNLFIFTPGYSEFGCGIILKYDIDNSALSTTSVAAPKSCATKFGKVNDYSIEYFGSTGDAGVVKNYHSIYYFKEDRIEDIN